MKSPTSVNLRDFAGVNLAYRRLRDDISNIEQAYPDSQVAAALSASMRRVLVQVVLDDRYIGSYVDGSLDEAATIAYTPISTLEDIHTIVRNNLKGKFQLTNDIDATDDCLVGGDYYNAGEGWEPIGVLEGGEGGNSDSGFQGIFDGAGYKITGIKIDRDSEDYQAFFGFIGTGGVVKNLEIVDTILSGRSQMGGFCGGNAGIVYNCHATDATVSGNNDSLDYSGNIGGFIGDNDGTCRLCTASGTVTGFRDVGGFSGDNDGLLEHCGFIGDVYCSVLADAGLISGDNKGFIEFIPMSEIPTLKGNIYGCYGVGTVQSIDIAAIGDPDPKGNIAVGVGDSRGGSISASYAIGTVTGKNPDVAGFVGNNDLGDNSLGETINSTISNCYCEATVIPTGTIADDGAVGGFAGKNKGGQIYDCYSISDITGTAGVEREHVEGFCGNNSNDEYLGVISGCYFNKTLYVADYGDEDSFSVGKTTAQLKQQETFEGWDFDNIWSIEEGSGYPTLPDMPEASTDETDGYVEVFPIQIVGTRPLSGDVRPKIVPGHAIFATDCEDDVVRTPIVVQDMNFPVTVSDLSDSTGGGILGDALDSDTSGLINVQVNDTNIHVNSENKLAIVDSSVGKSKLGDINGDSILGDGLDWNDTTEKIDVDLSEVDPTDFDFTDMADEETIGFDNPDAYDASTTYSEDHKVSDADINYKSLQDSNTGNTPASSSSWWEEIDSKVFLVKDNAIGKSKLGDINGGDILGNGLDWDANENIDVQVNDTNIHINGSNQIAVKDDSIGKSKLGDINGDSILGTALEWNAVTEKIDADLSGVDPTDLDFTDVVDEITIGFDNPKAYVATKSYDTDEKVSYSGINYVSIQDSNTGNTPTTPSVWWEDISSQKVIKIKEGLPGDGLAWSTNGKIEVYNGFGLDINAVTAALDVDPSEFNGSGLDIDGSGFLEVDLSEVISIDEDTLTADSTDQTNDSWYTVLEKAVTAAIGKNLDIRLFMPVKGSSEGKFNVQLCIGTSSAVGSTIVEGRYELPDNGNQIPVVMSVTREDITAADPYIRVQIKNDDYTTSQTHVDCADKDGQFTVIVF